MKVSIKAVAVAFGLTWASCMLLVGIINLLSPPYGADFLRIMSSVYPGFHDSHSWGSVALGTLYGFVDGAIGAAIVAWLYDLLVARPPVSPIKG